MSVRVSAPDLPSGRSAASTSKKANDPTRIISPAMRADVPVALAY